MADSNLCDGDRSYVRFELGSGAVQRRAKWVLDKPDLDKLVLVNRTWASGLWSNSGCTARRVGSVRPIWVWANVGNRTSWWAGTDRGQSGRHWFWRSARRAIIQSFRNRRNDGRQREQHRRTRWCSTHEPRIAEQHGGFGGGFGGRGGMGRNNFGNQNQNSDKPKIRATAKIDFDDVMLRATRRLRD